jgi:hypothetical protein
MSGAKRDEAVLVGIAATAAFAAGLLAVAQHAYCTSAGYQLAVARRAGIELRRSAAEAELRVTRLSTPQAATARAAAMKLTALKYPKSWNVVNAATLRACAVPADAAVAAAAPKAVAR